MWLHGCFLWLHRMWTHYFILLFLIFYSSFFNLLFFFFNLLFFFRKSRKQAIPQPPISGVIYFGAYFNYIKRYKIILYRSKIFHSFQDLFMVHIYWVSDARDQWSHARLHKFPGNKLCGIYKYTILVYHIVIVYVRNDHNMVKKYSIPMYIA